MIFAIICFVLSALVWTWFFWVNRGSPSQGYNAIADAVIGTFAFFVALTITLVIWLTWALLR